MNRGFLVYVARETVLNFAINGASVTATLMVLYLF